MSPTQEANRYSETRSVAGVCEPFKPMSNFSERPRTFYQLPHNDFHHYDKTQYVLEPESEMQFPVYLHHKIKYTFSPILYYRCNTFYLI